MTEARPGGCSIAVAMTFERGPGHARPLRRPSKRPTASPWIFFLANERFYKIGLTNSRTFLRNSDIYSGSLGEGWKAHLSMPIFLKIEKQKASLHGRLQIWTCGFCWCRRSELNRHVRRGHGILSPARLPVPPRRRSAAALEEQHG